MIGGTLTRNLVIRSFPSAREKSMSDELIAWVLKQWDLQIPVRRQDIQHKAIALIKVIGLQFHPRTTLCIITHHKC